MICKFARQQVQSFSKLWLCIKFEFNMPTNQNKHFQVVIFKNWLSNEIELQPINKQMSLILLNQNSVQLNQNSVAK